MVTKRAAANNAAANNTPNNSAAANNPANKSAAANNPATNNASTNNASTNNPATKRAANSAAAHNASTGATRVYLEIGKKKVFAAAIDWPGWCRSGRDEQSALDALATYLERYAPVVKRTKLALPTDTFTVVERIAGSTSTDFGVPEKVATADLEPVSAAEGKRIGALVKAAWAEFATIVAQTPEELTKGPRGGGRDRDKMTDHVLGAEASYGRKLGVKHKPPALTDNEAIAAMRADLVAALSRPWSGGEHATGMWPPRYMARRTAWHVLDHAWEMQDRTPR